MSFISSRRFFKKWAPFIFPMCGSIVFFEPISAETLKEALATAYQTNASLASAQAGTKAAAELLAQASAGWWPKAHLFGDVDQEYKDTSQSSYPQNSGYTDRDGTKVGLEVVQNIYSGGATEANSQKSEAEVQAANADYKKEEQKLLLAAIKAYLEVLKSQSVLDLTLKHESRLKKQLEQGKARFELGDLTLTDVAQIEAELSQATAEHIKAQGELESAQAQYVGVIGKAPDLLVFPEAPLFLPKDKKEAFEIALHQNPDYIKSQFDEQSRKSNVDIALAAMRPSVDVKLAATRNSNNDSFTKKSRVYDGIATASVKVPLDISGDAQSKVRKARLEASQKRLATRATRDMLSASISQKMDALSTTMGQIESFESLVKFKRIAQEGMILEEELETRTMTDRLKAETEYFEAQVKLIDARIKALTAHFELLGEMGELTLARLDVSTMPYNPESYVNEVSQAPYNLSPDDNLASIDKTENVTEELEKIK